MSEYIESILSTDPSSLDESVYDVLVPLLVESAGGDEAKAREMSEKLVRATGVKVSWKLFLWFWSFVLAEIERAAYLCLLACGWVEKLEEVKSTKPRRGK